MKAVLTFLAFGLFCSFGFSQSVNTKDIDEFIKTQGNYVFLNDSVNLPPIVNKHKPEIIKVIRKQNIKIKNALILIDNIKDDSSKIQLPVFDLMGFKKKFRMRTQKSDDGFPIMLMGNASGKDGLIIIDKINKNKTDFLIYE